MTTRRNVVEGPILRRMTAENPTSALASGLCCTLCDEKEPAPAPLGLAINGNSLTATNIAANSITTGMFTTLKAPEPQLTVKQAAKAFKKAVAARTAARDAEREARMAATRASKALVNAIEAEAKAREALTAAAQR